MKALYLCLELNSHPSAPALPSLYLCCVCPPLFISPPPVFAPSHFLSASLPALSSSYPAFRCPASGSSSVDCGLAEPNTGDESSSHQADQARTPNEICLSPPHNGDLCCSAVSPLISSDAARKAGDNLRGTRVAPRISNAGARSF